MGTPYFQAARVFPRSSTGTPNPWKMLSTNWHDDIAARLQGVQWSWYGHNMEFKKWYQLYYARPVFSGANSPKAAQSADIVISENETEWRNTFPEWWFNHKLQTRQRNSLILVMAKLRLEGLLDWFADLRFVGVNCEILFLPQKSAEDFYRHLLRNGYGDWWFAKEAGDPWGVRSRFSGLQLHFRGKHDTAGTLVDAHIDSFNPGDPSEGPPTSGWSELGDAIEHYVKDKQQRSTIDDPAVVWPRLRSAAEFRGIVLPWVL